MFLNVPLVADWQTIAPKREQHVNENLRRANQKRRQYDYAAGEAILKKVHNPTSLGVRTNGPYTIDRVHVNGTLTIRLRPGVTERINIRRVVPYRCSLLSLVKTAGEELGVKRRGLVSKFSPPSTQKLWCGDGCGR
eukprot:scaffold148074_cov71-Cyclotella_meneghiniana.AAC.1